MAEYQITMLTLAQPIPTKPDGYLRYAPWSNNPASISVSGGSLKTVTVTDDDPALDVIPVNAGETQQKLTTATIFGSGSYASQVGADSRLNFLHGSLIEDGAGNRFYVAFPRIDDGSGTYGSAVGGNTSVLVFPVPKTGGDGSLTYPSFDLTASYRLVKTVSSGTQEGARFAYAPSTDSGTGNGGDTPPCFAAGTLIETDRGLRPVEALQPGDLVLTRDGGAMPIRWIGCAAVDARRLDLQPNLRPIRIRAGALGPGMPARDLIVSPQHRVLVASRIVQRMFAVGETLVAAKHLVGLPGITVECPPGGVDYWHILLDRHQVIRSEGAWTESLLAGPMALQGFGAAARREILTLFPELAQPGAPTGARRLLTGREGRKLAQRHGRNGKALMAAG